MPSVSDSSAQTLLGHLNDTQGAHEADDIYLDGTPLTEALAAQYAPINMTRTYVSDAVAPTLTKYSANPILEAADTDISSLLWPWVLNVSAILGSPIDDYYMWFSTDHATSSGAVHLATAPSPLGPWTNYGLVYKDATGSGETETPAVIWNEVTDLFHMYYHQETDLGEIASQATILATSPDGITWTRVGIAIDITVDGHWPGTSHTGYFHPGRIGGQWYGHHLLGSGSPHFGVSYSNDGITWALDPRPLGVGLDQIETLGSGLRIEWNQGDVVRWRGDLWWIGAISNHSSGTETSVRFIVAAPIAPTLRNLLGTPTVILEGVAAWESTDIRSTCVFSEGGVLYVYYTAGTDAIGVAYTTGGA